MLSLSWSVFNNPGSGNKDPTSCVVQPRKKKKKNLIIPLPCSEPFSGFHYTQYKSSSLPWQGRPCVICPLTSCQRSSCVSLILEQHMLLQHWSFFCSWNMINLPHLRPSCLLMALHTISSPSSFKGFFHSSNLSLNISPSDKLFP